MKQRIAVALAALGAAASVLLVAPPARADVQSSARDAEPDSDPGSRGDPGDTGASDGAPGGDAAIAEGGDAAEAPEAPETPETIEELSDRVRELEDIVGELERKTALQRLGWSADYRITLSSFRYEGESPDGARNADGTPRKVVLDNQEQWTHRARLSLQTDPTGSLRFRARLVVFKRFGDSAFVPVLESSAGRVPRDATARFDRFWIDWFLTQRWSLSLGRISATDGSPSELRENLDRPASTLSLGLIDREYDAVAATYQVGNLLLRGFYLSWQFQRADDIYTSLPFLARSEAPMRTYGAAVQYRSTTPAIPNFDITAFISPRFRALPPLDLPIGGRLVSPTYVPNSLGRVMGATALLLWRDMVKGLDAFLAGSISHVNPNGESLRYPIGPDGASIPVLTLTSADSDSHVGLQVYSGFRLTMPFGGKHAPKTGFEFTFGNRNILSFATPTSDLVTRLGLRGRTYDLYYIQPIYSNLFARLSATILDYDYTPPLGGALGFVPELGGTHQESDRMIRGFNLALHASF